MEDFLNDPLLGYDGDFTEGEDENAAIDDLNTEKEGYFESEDEDEIPDMETEENEY